MHLLNLICVQRFLLQMIDFKNHLSQVKYQLNLVDWVDNFIMKVVAYQILIWKFHLKMVQHRVWG